MATLLVTDKSGLVIGRVSAKAGMVTRHCGTVTRSTAMAVWTDKPSSRLHGMHRPIACTVNYTKEIANDSTFVPCGFLSQRSADELRGQLAKGLSVREIARNYATYVDTVKLVLNSYPAN